MIEKLALKLVDELQSNQLILETQKDEYMYVFLTEFEKIITLFSVFLISVFTKQYLNAACFTIAFFCLRYRAGGAHFSTFRKCYIGTLMLYIFIFYIINSFGNNRIFVQILLITTFASTVVVFSIGCVNHLNMNMDELELNANKIRSRYAVVLELGLVLYLFILDAKIGVIESIELAIIVCAVLMIISKMMGQEVKESE